MKVQYISLENFRNHGKTRIDCSPGLNILLGNNGEGKTNAIEGISYLCLSKSYYAANDDFIVKIGEQGFVAMGEILTESKVLYQVRIDFDKTQKQKTITINKERIEKLSSIIGKFPVVILSPEQSAITSGLPLERRKFVDFVIAQSSRTYLENLIEYRRILKQRNKILADICVTGKDQIDVLEPWNKNFIVKGTKIMEKRIEFIKNFQGVFESSYVQIAGTDERPTIKYIPAVECKNETSTDELQTAFARAIENYFIEERKAGFSLVGPHRDEFLFKINNLDVRNYASQGQHKTLLIALKIAEFFYLKERCQETPIVLLDDVLSELDAVRAQRLVESMSNLGQIFITATDERALKWVPATTMAARKFHIRQGRIERIENTALSN